MTAEGKALPPDFKTPKPSANVCVPKTALGYDCFGEDKLQSILQIES
jgi:hypothetical protein